MNSLTLFLDPIVEVKIIDGISFSNVGIIRCWIDGEALDDLVDFSGSLMYFEELEASKLASGRYLIFTCACGIAEDGGWDGVIVNHTADVVEWEIAAGSKTYFYEFDKNQYFDQIALLKKSINLSLLPMEPNNVIFPLHFHRCM